MAVKVEMDMSLEGVKSLMDQFDQLDKRTAMSGLKKVARKGGNVFLREVRRAAPVDTGQLAKSIKLTVKVLPRIGQVSALTKAKSNKSGITGRNPVHYNHLVIRGAKPHGIPGPVSVSGQVFANVFHPGVQGNPYVDRAANRKQQQAIKVVARELANELAYIKTVAASREVFK